MFASQSAEQKGPAPSIWSIFPDGSQVWQKPEADSGLSLLLEVCGLNWLGFPPCGRAYFLLLRQKRVAKEKATPGYAHGYAGFPALLGTGGGCGTRGYAPQTVLALFPPAPPLLGAPHGDPKGGMAHAMREKNDLLRSTAKKGQKSNPASPFQPGSPSPPPDKGEAGRGFRFSGPLEGAEQRRNAGGSRLALSEPQASLASRPAFRVAQGTRAAGTDPGVAFFLATFSWPHKKKYARAASAETPAN
jgi:hypothetical protein